MKSVLEKILDTVMLGGRLILFQDQAPQELQTVVAHLKDHAGKIPFLLVSAAQVQTRTLMTHPADLILAFSGQTTTIKSLLPVLQGHVLSEGLEPLQSSQLWRECAQALAGAKPVGRFAESFSAPCLFLDRDDVVVKNVPYNRDPALVELMPGVVDLINEAHQKNYWVALVTNQSGLGRGWISWSEYQKVHQKMLQLLAAQGAWIDECVWASYYEQPGVEEGRLFSNLRKPSGGMFQVVGEKLRVNFAKSVMVGDSASDLIAAHSVQIPNLYLLHSEKIDKETASLGAFQKDAGTFSYKSIQKFSEVKL